MNTNALAISAYDLPMKTSEKMSRRVRGISPLKNRYGEFVGWQNRNVVIKIQNRSAFKVTWSGY